MLNILVLSGYGLNCEEETAFAFIQAAKKLAFTKYNCEIVHINDLLTMPHKLRKYHILVLPGGFSYGDDTGAGNAFALRLQSKLRDELENFFIEDKLVIGICNGCQILLRLHQEFHKITLIKNNTQRYECRWIRVEVSNRRSVWLRDINTLYLPIAHGEGRFYTTQAELRTLIHNDYVALRYIKPLEVNTVLPYNPNGSIYDIAGLNDKSGRILALMPHPERNIFFTQQDNWPLLKEKYRRQKVNLPVWSNGLQIFCNAITYFM